MPASYPEAGGVAIVMVGANGNSYFQFSDPDGAFVGFQNSGSPAAFRGNPFTINDPLTLNCGFSSCSDYFGGSISEVHIRFSAYDGDTQPGGFDENDITLRLNGFDVGSWSGLTTEATNTNGNTSFGFGTGFGNRTFDTGWFSSTNPALLGNILSTGQTTTQVYDDDPNDNYWDFTRGLSLTDQDIVTVAPGYEIEKSADKTTFAAVGETITYSYVVTNIGSVPISNLEVSDDKIANVTCDKTTIRDTEVPAISGGVADFATCTATYQITQEDFDAGQVTNIASAIGEPSEGSLGELVDTLTITGPAIAPSVQLTKSTTLSEFGAVGTTVPYTFVVLNTGDATLTDLVVTDPLIPSLSCEIDTLLPNEQQSCTASYTVTQDDVDDFATSGTELENTAEVNGDAPQGFTVSDTDSTSIPSQTPVVGLELEKTAITADYDEVGDTVQFNIVITNTGNVTYPSAPTVTDVLTDGATCPVGPVAPNASVTCVADYDIMQGDIDAGQVLNEASAEITIGGLTASDSDTATIDAIRTSGLTLDKMLAAASPVNFSAPSVGLTYDYVLTNTGNVTLETPTVSDNRVAVTCSATEIAPNTSITCTSDVYSTTQTDVNDGGVTNIATASANEAGTGTAVPSNQDQVTVPALQSPELTLVKTAPTVLAADFQVGETVTYTFDVTNSGNIDLAAQIEITDDKIGTFDCGVGGLVTGGIVQCTADYILDADDITAGVVVNVATAASGATTSDQVTATIAPVLTPSIGLVKSSTTASVAAVTDTIQYVFTVTNTGDTQILKSTQPISINDSLLAGAADCSAQPATLETGQSFDCTATYASLDQEDLDAGSVSNTATASFDFSQGGVTVTIESDASTAVVPVVQNVDFTLDKSGPLTFSALDESLSYSFDLTNTGNVTIESLSVSDPLIPALACSFTDVAPGGTETCTGTYAVDQDDIDAESILNIATATAETALNADVVKTDTHTATSIPAAQTKSVALSKTADLSPFTAVGEVITYTLAVESTGLQTLTDVVVADILDPSYSCTIPTLAPNEISSICTFTYTVTQDDIDAGSIINGATASSPEITTATDTLTIPGPARTASYEFTKSHDVDFVAKDDVVTFGFAVENTGTTTLTNVVITDPFFGTPVMCTIPAILPGATDTSCSASYSVTQADVDAGSITNMASVTVDAPAGVDDPLDQDSTVVVDGPAESASIEIVKAAADGTYGPLGDTEVFTFTVTNTGNVTLTGLVVTDADLGFSCALDDLAPNANTTQCTGGAILTATKTVTQTDIDLGSYTNSVSVVGTSAVNGTGVSDDDVVTISGPAQLPAISMAKTETLGTTFDTVGQAVPYTFTITNTGNITLTGAFTVDDDKIASVVCPATPSAGVAVGGQLVCTGEHIVTQNDLDTGFITNKAEATTVQPVIPTTLGGASIVTVVSGEETETILANQTPALELDKHVLSTSPSSYAAVGDIVTFEYVVTNTGNVTTTADITILDDKIPGTHTCSATLIAPNDTVTCTIDWAADQSAIDAGEVTNSATANTIFDSSPVQSPVDTATVTAVQTPSLVVEKTFTGTNNVGFFNENDILSYDITVTNNGNVTLSAPFSLDDNLVAPVCAVVPATLAPTESYDCTAVYSVTQNDLDLGAATNVITATGTFGGDDVVSPSDNAIYPVDADPALFLTKTVVSGADFSQVGDIVTYDFTVTNQGNVGLSDDIFINDLLLSTSPILCRDASALGSALPAGAGAASSYTCQQTYSVTQDDLDAGEIVNNATAETVYAPLTASTNVVSPNATATIDADDTPALTVAKIVTSGDNPANLGDLLSYQITVTNSGNQTLSGITVADPLIPTLTCTVGGAAAPANVVLAPNAAMICTGTYTVTQDDMDALLADGSNSVLTNTANARGSDPQGDSVTGMGSNDHPLDDPAPAVSLEKTITPEPGPDDAFSTVGQPVSFVLAVTNDGNVTLDSTVVTDSRTTTPASCTLGPIAPGETDSSCVVEYIITQADFDVVNNTGSSDFAGFTNTGTAKSTPANPGAADVSATGDVFVRGPEHEPLFALVKDADKETFSTFGETITYTYTVANIGNITLFATPSIEDDKIGTFACGTIPAGGLAPEEFITCTATYNVKQEDLDSGSVTNIAKVTSTEVTTAAEATETVDAVQMPDIAITKTPSITSDAAAGDVIEYIYTVENTGNVTLTDVTLEDTQTHAGGTTALVIGGDTLTTDANETGTSPDGQGPGVWGTLSTSDKVTFTSSYTVTQADVDAQVTLSNTASATGTGPTGTTPPEDDVTVTVPTIAKTPSIDIRKTADDSGLTTPAVLGQIVSFEIEIENTGNQTLTDVELTDVFADDAGGTLSLTGPNKIISTDPVDVGVLNVGETWVYEASYALTQDAIDAGGIENTASVTAKDPQLVTVDDAIDALVEVDIARDIDLAVVKTAVITDTVAGTDGVIDAGDTITYTYVVHNTGNTTLLDIDVTETGFTGAGDTPEPAHASGGVDLGGDGAILDLAVGSDTVTFSATYILTQDDLDTGFVDNQATATASAPDGSTPSDTSDESGTAEGDDDPTKTTLAKAAELSVIKVLDGTAPTAAAAVGDELSFTITVRNTGNVTLDDVTVADTLTDATGEGLTIAAPVYQPTAAYPEPTGLIPGDSLTYTATFALDQQAIDAGGISNTVTATATDPDGASVSDVSDDDTEAGSDPTVVALVRAPDLAVVKTAVIDDTVAGTAGVIDAGDTVTYTYVVHNTGNTTLLDIDVTETGFTGAGDTPEPAHASGGVDLGGDGAILDLAVGSDTVTFKATYILTQDDIDTGFVDNQATASATGPDGSTPTDTSDESGTADGDDDPTKAIITPLASLDVVKTVDDSALSSPVTVGDSVVFTISAENTGNVSLETVTLDDTFTRRDGAGLTLTPTISNAGTATNNGDATLDVGEIWTYSATHILTQDDIDAGGISNTVEISAETPDGSSISDVSDNGDDTDGNTDDDPAALNILGEPDLTLSKTLLSGANPYGALTDTLTYQFVVTNTGNITITAPVTISDPLITDAGGLITCSAPPVAPNGTFTCTGSYDVTQADLDADNITNTATASVPQPLVPFVDGGPTSAVIETPEDGIIIPSDQRPALTISKIIDPDSPTTFAAIGDQVTFVYTVTNTGNVTTTAPITVSDDQIPNGGVLPGVHACSSDLIAPMESVTCELVWTADQDALDAGEVTNTATAETTFDGGAVVTAEPATATATAIQTKELSLVKTLRTAVPDLFDEDTVLTYDFVVKNEGNVSIDAPIAVNDLLIDTVTCTQPASGKLAPQGTVACTATYTLTANDIALGSTVNVASATGTFDGAEVTSPTDNAIYPVDGQPSLALVKDSIPSDTSFDTLGEIIEYTYTVTNDGKAGFTGDVFVNDDKIDDPILCHPATNGVFGVGNIATCTAEYRVTQDDLDAGFVTNEATANSIFAPGTTNEIPVSSIAALKTVTSIKDAALTVVKTVSDGPSRAVVGDTIEYTITTTNTGNQTIAGVTVADPLIPVLSCTVDGAVAPANVVLAPSEALVCVGTYEVDQDDIDAQILTNTATARGADPQGGNVVDDGTALQALVDDFPSVDVTKALVANPGTGPAFTAPGETLEFVITVENNGNVTLNSTTISDDLETTPATCEVGVLAPGESDSSCIVSYVTTQDDVNAVNTVGGVDFGGFINTATAVSLPATPNATTVTDDGAVFVLGPEHMPSFDILKEADVSVISAYNDEITYTYTITNSGNITLFDQPVVTDDKIANVTCAPIAATGMLPNDTLTCTGTYNATQADIDDGFVTNIASVASDEVPLPAIAGDAETSLTIPATRTPAIEIDKVADIPTEVEVNDVVTYTYSVTNTGNVTLTNIALDDQHTTVAGTVTQSISGDALDTDADEQGNSVDAAENGGWDTLGPNDVVTFTSTYTVTQADIDAQILISNTVVVTSESPTGTIAPTDSATETVTSEVGEPELTVLKSADTTGLSTPPQAGDVISFGISVANTGNQSLDNIALVDTFVQTDGTVLALSNGPTFTGGDAGETGTIEVGETWTYAADYTLTQDDINAGGVSNSVLVTSDSPDGTNVEDISDVDPETAGDDEPTVVQFPAIPSISGAKTLTSTTVEVGGIATFEITAQNTGNVTLTDVAVASETLTRVDGTVLELTSQPVFTGASLGSGAGTLEPTETATYLATYILTQDDVDAGGIINTATVTGTPPIGSPVTDITDSGQDGDAATTDEVTVLDIPAAPSISLDKRLAAGQNQTYSVLGEAVNFEFEITNTGNVTLDGPFSVADPLIAAQGGSVSCGLGALVPNASVVCEGVYNVTQDDLDFGSFENAATATDGTVSSDDVVTVPALQLPEMTIGKVAEDVPAASFVIGAQVNYTYTVTNVGNVTISEPIIVSDNLIAANDITCPAFPEAGIAPNGTYICEGIYTVTSTDVDLQAVTNLASATDGETTTPLTSETIPDAGVPSLSVTKTAEAGATFAEVGNEIEYTFVVTNTGTQSFVRPIVVHDDKLGEIVCLTPSEIDDFRPTETATCTGTHIVTQDDLDAGKVVNEAFALTSFGLTDTPVASAPVTETVDAELAPALSLDKTVTSPVVTAVGQVIEYTLTATNVGNQTLTNVVIEDPKLTGFSCSTPTLLRDDSVSCTGDYTVTQADVDLGTFTNTASTFGITPQGVALDPTEDSVTSQMPAVTGDVVLTKTATPSPFGAVGSTLTYSFAVENQSNVTIKDLTVTDVMDPSFACEIASIAPGATDNTCSYAITVTQDHVDAGEIENTGEVTGVDARGNTVGDVDTIVTPGPERLGSIEVTKIILPSASAVGSLVTYQLLVENTGNVTVDVETPVDTMVRLNGASVTLDAPFALEATSDTDSDGRLDVGETWSYTATYTLSQADLNAGGLSNVVSVAGVGAGGGPVNDTSDDGIDNDGNTLDDPTIFEIAQDPELTVTKTIASSEGIEAGDTVVFEIEALNTGNVDLTDLGLVDTLRNMSGAALTPETPVVVDVPDTLSPGAAAKWTVSYTLTQDDVDAGGIFNSATVSGQDPENNPVSDVSADGDTSDGNLTDDPTVLPIAPAPAMEVIKQITDLPVNAGEDAVFTITVQNTGSVTLTDIELVDTLTNFDGDVVGPVTLAFVAGQQSTVEGVLQIQETATYTATYTLTQDDVDSGGIINTVTATAETPLGAILTDVSDDGGSGIDDPTVAPITATPDFELIKTASDPFPLFPTVDQVTFTITVENTGNITQTGIQVVDDLAAFVAPATLLAEAYPVEVRVSDFTNGTANTAYDGVDVIETLAGNATLAPGEIGTIQIVTVYSTATGQPAQANIGSVVSDQLGQARTGSAEVTFIDSDGDGAPDYLESSTEDRDGDGIVDSADYDPTGYFYCEENGQILSGGSISVSGGGFTQTGVGTSGPIVIVQDGTSGYFQFFVTSAGSYTLGITYPPAGSASVDHTSLGTIDATSLLPDNPASIGSNEFGSTGVLSDYTPASNPFYTTFDIEAGDPSILNNNIPLRNCAAVTNVLATKTADRTSAVFGDTVNFTLTYTNNTSLTYSDAAFIDLLPEGMIYTPDSARVDGVAIEPIVEGRRLVWTEDLAPAQTLTINLSARIASSGSYGVLTNRSWVETSDGSQISNMATAEVSIEPEHVFDCTDVIGKVFDDRNGNGYQDGAGSDTALIIDQDAWVGGKFATPEVVNTTEPGLPGVRLVAPDGTTITTDEYGRYSVPCAALPASIGSNFILKLDTRSLPTGYRVTTENPRVERLTAGKFAKMNFGATAANLVTIDLTAAAYDRNSVDPSAGLIAGLDGVLTQIKETPSTLRLSYLRQAHETPETAQARLNAVEESIKQLWRGRGNYKLIIEKIIVRAR